MKLHPPTSRACQRARSFNAGAGLLAAAAVACVLAGAARAGDERVIYSFAGEDDGGYPNTDLALDAAGNLYGTCVIGGSGGVCVEDGCGVVFKLTDNGGTWTQSVIHDFTGGADGYGSGGPVVFDAQGRLYGTTPTGGTDGFGIVYQLTPQPGGLWTEKVIHTFTGGADGGGGLAGRLLIQPDGTIYGICTFGGEHGEGTAWQMKPTMMGGWTFTTIYAFQGTPDAGFPYGGLVADASGALYGTTYYDGAFDLGSVYRLEKVGGAWQESVLHSFKGGSDGSGSISGMLLTADGALYGTTAEGGAACNCGTIFKLSKQPGGVWRETVAYRFTNVPDGAYPYSALVADPSGKLYGATVRGGDDNEGAIFRFTP